MDIEIDLNKSVDENAGIYYNKAKKAKKKLQGALKAIEESKKKLEQLQQQERHHLEQEHKKQAKTNIKRQWYEKFHWFISSEDFLCIGGRDATTNELIIKKHLEKDDLVFHTEAPGSPFFIIKNGQTATEITIHETAQATAVYSKAWKYGHTIAEVFYVKPEQVTKETKSGEFIQKGSFMIYGKKTIFHPKLEYTIGLIDDIIIAGPETAINKKTNNYLLIIPGEEKKSSIAKKIKAKLKGGDLDDIIRFLPGEADIKK